MWLVGVCRFTMQLHLLTRLHSPAVRLHDTCFVLWSCSVNVNSRQRSFSASFGWKAGEPICCLLSIRQLKR